MANQRVEYIYDVYIQLPGNEGENLWTLIGSECHGIANALYKLNDYALQNDKALHMVPSDYQGGIAYNTAILEVIKKGLSGTESEFIFSWFSKVPVKFVINRKILV